MTAPRHRTATFTDDQREALLCAVEYYVSTVTKCYRHDDDHGNESDCEGWGPAGLADLEAGLDALYAS